jgi:hypothetical protein
VALARSAMMHDGPCPKSWSMINYASLCLAYCLRADSESKVSQQRMKGEREEVFRRVHFFRAAVASGEMDQK